MVILLEFIVLCNDIVYYFLGEMGSYILFFCDCSIIFEVVGFNKVMKEFWIKELELDCCLFKVIDILFDDGYFNLFYQFKDCIYIKLKVYWYGLGVNFLDFIIIVDFGYFFYILKFILVYLEDKSKMFFFLLKNRI